MLQMLLVVAHVIGTVLGAGGATIAEVNLVQATKNGKPHPEAKRLMHANYTVIRVGTALIVLSGIALVMVHVAQGHDWMWTSAKLGAKTALTVLIVVNAIALARRWVPLWLGAALSFASWWAAAILGVWRNVELSFWEITALYVVWLVCVAVGLHFIRAYAKKST